MSQFIATHELDGLNEQELRALHGRIISDLRAKGLSAQEQPHVYASLRNIEAAILRLQQRPQPCKPKPPGF